MRDEGTETLLLLAAGAPEKALLEEAARVGWRPQVLIPGFMAGAEVFDFPESVDRQVFLAFPTLPTDHTPAGLLEYERLAKKYQLPVAFPEAQMTTLSSARILVEGLKRAGSELSREGLLAALEDLRDFDTQLTPQVTYGPNRRVGIRGAHIVSLDLAGRTFVPVSDGVEAD
jgi:ABC-type branched-subunit amino acid transport system substrate-binding protein